MTEIQNHTAEELQAIAAEASHQAQQAQAELNRRAEERAAAENEARATRDRDIIDRHVRLDEQLTIRAKECSDAFDQAVRDRDLPAAFAAWVNEHATREARRHIRDEAGNAETRQQTGRRILPDLRYVEADLCTRLEDSGMRAAADLGEELAASLIGE